MTDPKEQRRSVVRKAVAKFDAEKVDKATIRFPKGTKDKIQAAGRSLNSYTVEAVIEKMDRDGINND